MRPPRPADWLIYSAVVGALTAAAIFSQTRANKPRPSPPPSETVGFALAPASPFDPSLVVKAPTGPGGGAGTAFSVAGGGVWLTARHVVEGCARTAIVVGPGRGLSATVRLVRGAETAILITKGGAPPLPLWTGAALHGGAIAFHPGFPHGRPGEAASRLIGRQSLVMRGRGRQREPVLAWARVDRTAGLPASLAGISGAPALDEQGRVMGLTVAQSPRHGRLYTTTPAALRAALADAGVTPEPSAVGEPIAIDNYSGVADDLRRKLRVVQVVCLVS